jgi:hypothetical protein
MNVPLAWLLTMASLATGLKEIYELWTSPSVTYYFTQLENVLQLIVISSAVLNAWPVLEFDLRQVSHNKIFLVIRPWSYQVAAVRENYLLKSVLLLQLEVYELFEIRVFKYY